MSSRKILTLQILFTCYYCSWFYPFFAFSTDITKLTVAQFFPYVFVCKVLNLIHNDHDLSIDFGRDSRLCPIRIALDASSPHSIISRFPIQFNLWITNRAFCLLMIIYILMYNTVAAGRIDLYLQVISSIFFQVCRLSYLSYSILICIGFMFLYMRIDFFFWFENGVTNSTSKSCYIFALFKCLHKTSYYNKADKHILQVFNFSLNNYK